MESISNFAERLRKMADGNGGIDIAKFEFIDLHEVEQAYGDRWPAQKARVLESAHAYLSKRLSPDDILIKGGGGFIVVSGAGGGPETSIAAATLAHGLNGFFLGEMKQAPAPRMGVQSSSVSVEGLIKTLGDVPYVAAPIGPPEQQLVAAMGVDWRYQPVWDVRREALGSYHAVPYLLETQSRLKGYQFESTDGPPKSFVSIDEAGLRVAEQGLRALFEKEGRAQVGMTVHSSSLTNLTARAKIVAVLRRFDKNLLKYRRLKIANVIPGFPRIYLNEIIGAVRPYVPSVVIGAAWDEPDIGGLVQVDCAAIGFALPFTVLAKDSLVTPTELLARIRHAADVAHAAKKTFFIEGGITRELAVRLSAIGVDTIASPLIWPVRAAPETAVKWPADRLLAA